MPADTESVFLTIAQVAEVFGVCRTAAYKQIGAGTFPVPVIKVGGRMKVRRVDLDHFTHGGVSA